MCSGELAGPLALVSETRFAWAMCALLYQSLLDRLIPSLVVWLAHGYQFFVIASQFVFRNWPLTRVFNEFGRCPSNGVPL